MLDAVNHGHRMPLLLDCLRSKACASSEDKGVNQVESWAALPGATFQFPER